MTSFDDNLKRDCILSLHDRMAKISIQFTGSSGFFYATGIKVLKCDYRNPIFISHIHFKSLFEFLPSNTITEYLYETFTKN